MDLKLVQHRIALYRDEGSYKKLFLHFYDDLLLFSLSYVRQREMAEEVVSDVMMKIWAMGGELENIQSLKTYLFTAVKNTSINYLAKVKDVYRHVELDPEFHVDHLNPEDMFIEKELFDKIVTEINKLPPKCRMAYTLVRGHDCSYNEAATIMGVSENTIDRHIQIALQRLGLALKPYR